ncbi:MAG: hypothetical protein H7296_00200 [Bacteroidia bacterium]|nr:hypothetical protein [Bacteroidia bacterium]
MKKRQQSIVILVFCVISILSSCSRQMYGYRKTVSVNTQTAQVKQEVRGLLTGNKTIMSECVKPAVFILPTTKLSQSSSLVRRDNINVDVVLSDINQMMPQGGSKASAQAPKMAFKYVNEQLKTIKKDIQKLERPADINGRRWMVIGAILLLIGLIISLIIGGSYIGYVLGTIGIAIFIIGLLFYLIDYV